MNEIIANLKHAARNGGASIGGGEFSPAECRQAAAALTHAADLLEALEFVIRGVPDTWEGVQKARAAIAKATGGAK